ncbi:hypothetical protein [Streptomyces sp. 7-21]|uniref:hypothetical protein n=1 Tax=Streptomyces sp. 7-21 TaxID=2802283 RepID=UPI00191EA489|nr:hypothetical protein [Streptomyces sp. 7-21]MBL1065563.1 hypothetical protein [Streptomyces sp. 7-21]
MATRHQFAAASAACLSAVLLLSGCSDDRDCDSSPRRSGDSGTGQEYEVHKAADPGRSVGGRGGRGGRRGGGYHHYNSDDDCDEDDDLFD